MGRHRERLGWRHGAVTAVVAVLLTAEAVIGFIFIVVAVELARTL